MDVVHERCAGLDVHQKTVVACVRLVADGQVTHEVRTFGTTTGELLALSEWLAACGVTHVAMESTGVFWKPVWHVLEEPFALLLAHGLLRGSFVPPAPIQQLRDLTRTRAQLVREVGRHTLRLQRVLEDANVKLAAVVSDILGVSGRAILDALVAGEDDPEHLAALTTGRLRASRASLVAALHGRITAHHRFLLALHLGQIDALRAAIAALEARLEEIPRPFRAQVERLKSVPGVSDTAVRVLLGEIGIDMSRFPTAGHLRSWAGLSPRLHEGAGKRISTRTRPGTPWLKTTLVQAAWAAVRPVRAHRLRFRPRARLLCQRGLPRLALELDTDRSGARVRPVRLGAVQPSRGRDRGRCVGGSG